MSRFRACAEPFSCSSLLAICALSPSNENSYLAHPSESPSRHTSLSSSQPPVAPSSSHAGTVSIYDTLSLSPVTMIQAHKSPVAALAINSQGTMLATASDKGTVIRVFSLPDGKRLGEYRRGTKSAKVHSINFNPAGTLLAVSSDTETVHIYNLLDGAGGKGAAAGEEGSIADDVSSPTMSASGDPLSPGGLRKDSSSATASFSRRSIHLGKNLALSAGNYLPKGVSDIWEPKRDFAYLRLRGTGGSGGRCIVALSGVSPHVMVISSTGLFQAYAIDLEHGGECQLVKEYP